MTKKRKRTGKEPALARQRTPVNDELRTKWAIERFSGGINEIREIAQSHGRAEAVVSRAIGGAFRDGLVEVRRVHRLLVKRISEMEVALRNRFEFLRAVIVVDVADPDQDLTHEHLGQALASYLFDYPLADSSRVLVGAGRCIFHMADGLRRIDATVPACDSVLISVCGDSYPYHDDIRRNTCLDANANVCLLAQLFRHRAQIGLTSRHIFMNEADTRWHRQYYEQFWTEPPTLGLLGIGVLDSQHQLFQLTDADRSKDFPPVAISEELRTRIRAMYALAQEIGSDRKKSPKTVLAELGMHLFYVPGAGSEPDDPARVTRLQELIATVNAALFAPRIDHLLQVRSLLLVGGGAEKAAGLRHLLQAYPAPQPAGLRIRALCVDRAAAQHLLRG